MQDKIGSGEACGSEGQWVDLACTEAGTVLNGPALLDYTVNGRPLRRLGSPNSNRSQFPRAAPHGIYPSSGEDRWVALGCRDDEEWAGHVDLRLVEDELELEFVPSPATDLAKEPT